MTEILVQRQGHVLLPISASDERELILLPERRIITLEANAKAPLRLRRWYWAMLQLLVEATGNWPTKQAAHEALLIRCGYFESVVINGDGTTRFTAQSVVEWQFLEWRAYIDVLMPIISANYIGETPAKFRDRVDRFLGIKMKEAWQS